MNDRSYRCEACGMTSRLSAVDREEALESCPWCGEGLQEAEEESSQEDRAS